nr:GNAT family N-acetyltransferase [Isoptericola halotolerans]
MAALTFPLACPPGTPVATMAAHVAAHLTPARFTDWALSADHRLLVADDGGAPAGYALLARGEPGDEEAAALRTAAGPGPYVELSKIYVRPDHLGAGTAARLMATASEEAAQLAPGLPYWLGTNSENTRAQAFYRRYGFDVVGRRTYVVGGVEHDDIVMLRGDIH